jgi:hypothetical protein
MFSGGTYDEVARWLRNFLTSHAKRVNPRVEVVLDAGDAREGKSYGARLRVGTRVSPVVELDFHEVAEGRGSLAWCAELAERTQALARELLAERGTADARTR